MPTSDGKVTEEAASSLESEAVREALESLYDSVALARSPLRHSRVSAAGVAGRAQQLRRLLLDAIAALQPGSGYVFGSVRNRSYDVLNLRYAEGNAIADIAAEIGITERQVYRDLQRAREELTAYLEEPLSSSAADATNPAADDALSGELASLATSPVGVDLPEVAGSVIANTSALAADLGCTIDLDMAEDLPRAVADEGILRQILTQAISAAVQCSSPGGVAVVAAATGDRVMVTVDFRVPPDQERPRQLDVLMRVAQAQSMACELAVLGGERRRLALSLTAAPHRRLLVIDDNPGALQLYRRYLAQWPEWLVSGVQDARIAPEVARQLRPDAILLDIMMPRVDGWSVMRSLRAQEETGSVPVFVCSVFDDAALARSLGAVACLRKPVSQADLLTQLGRCLTPRT